MTVRIPAHPTSSVQTGCCVMWNRKGGSANASRDSAASVKFTICHSRNGAARARNLFPTSAVTSVQKAATVAATRATQRQYTATYSMGETDHSWENWSLNSTCTLGGTSPAGNE